MTTVPMPRNPTGRQKDYYVVLKTGNVALILATDSHDKEIAMTVGKFMTVQEGRLNPKAVFNLRKILAQSLLDGLYLLGEMVSVEHVQYEEVVSLMNKDPRNKK